MRVVALEPELAAAWGELFDACSSSCFCRYWHFTGHRNDWLARSAHHAEANREEQLACVHRQDAEARGLLAMEAGVALGWMKLVPRTCVGKLTRLPVYRNLALGNADGVYVIGCLLVRPEARRRDVARRLVRAADEHVRTWGGKAIEAYPRHAELPLHDEEAWMGPEKIYRETGYTLFLGEDPYPVYRKDLGGPARTELKSSAKLRNE
jgi:GNAT superfamily N-acetyltransferase